MITAPRVTVIECDQRSPEWHQARLGRLTSSRAADMLSTTQKGTEAAKRRNLRVQLALERITGRSAERAYMNGAMQHGVDTEAEAIAYYEAITGRIVRRTGFLAHTELMAGASLDGQVGDDGICEIKCPESATHLEYLRTGDVPSDYLKQIQHQLWISGAAWCDWMSYDPAFPEELRAKVVRVERVEKDVKAYELLAVQFLREVEAEVEEIRKLKVA